MREAPLVKRPVEVAFPNRRHERTVSTRDSRRKYLRSAMLNPSANHSSGSDEFVQRTFILKSVGDNCIIIAGTPRISHRLCRYYLADSTTADCEIGLYVYFINEKNHFLYRMKEGLTDAGYLAQEQHMHFGVKCMQRE